MTNKQLFTELRRYNWNIETRLFDENIIGPFIRGLEEEIEKEFTEEQEGLIKAYYISELLENTYVLE